MTKDVVPSEIQELLQEAGGSYLEAYHLLVKRRSQAVVSAPKSTIASRTRELRRAIEQLDDEALSDLQRKLESALETIHDNEVAVGPGPILDDQQKISLMQEFLDERDIKELFDARKEMLKEIVFSHLTAQFVAQGVENPEHQNGEIQVPELGHRFVRERCGKKDATLDEEKLQSLLGDQWELVCETKEIPAQWIPQHTEYVLREDKLLELAQQDPSVYRKLLECLEVGGWKEPTFTVKPLKG